MDNDIPLDNKAYPPRRTLPPLLADQLLDAHLRSGATYRTMARKIRTDPAHWWRITRGDRCPSREVAERIVTAVDLPSHVAEDLVANAVERHWEDPREAPRLTPLR